jgi:adenosine deaminase
MISSKFITSINEIKKVELHVHIEGTLSLERYSYLSVKNSLNIDEANMVIGLRLNQSFNNLAEFLKIYYLWVFVICCVWCLNRIKAHSGRVCVFT